MLVVFASSACSKEKYAQIFNMRKERMIDPAQKFLEQIIVGTAQNQAIEVVSLSARPVSASSVDQYFFSREEETIDGVSYIYPGFFNGKISRIITTYITGFVETFRVLKKNSGKDTVLVCDPLCSQIAGAARLAAKIKKVKAIAIVTDIPTYATEMKQHDFSAFRHKLQQAYERQAYRETLQYDGYINLTQYMDPLVNPCGKPSVILEGSVDFNAHLIEKDSKEFSRRIVMYAGGVYEKYGLKHLAEAFIKARIEDAELHVYGEGSFVEGLKQISKENPCVIYKGVAMNTDLPQIESQATLLVNPRFSGEEYTKYSFPSKTLEYMSSGTPVLTTRLAGIPEEYAPYLYYFEEETVDAMAEMLKNVLNQSDEELFAFGKRAKEFVLERKNNVVQGQRICDFAKEVTK